MSDLIYISKDFNQGNRPRSLCARCTSMAQNRQRSPGRGAWLRPDKERKLSIEIDGREGRSVRRRHSSSSADREQCSRLTGSHCFIIPTVPNVKSTTTTYRDDFKSPRDLSITREVYSPLPLLSTSLPESSSRSPSRSSSSNGPGSNPMTPTTPPVIPAGVPTRFQNGAQLKRSNTLSNDQYRQTKAPWM